MDKLERVAQIVQAEIFAFNDGGWGVDDDAAKAIAARILAALEPVAVQEAARVLLADGYAVEALSHWLQMMPSQVKSVLGDLAERGE